MRNVIGQKINRQGVFFCAVLVNFFVLVLLVCICYFWISFYVYQRTSKVQSEIGKVQENEASTNSPLHQLCQQPWEENYCLLRCPVAVHNLITQAISSLWSQTYLLWMATISDTEYRTNRMKYKVFGLEKWLEK